MSSLFTITRDSFIVCVIFIVIGLIFLAIRWIYDFLTHKKAQRRPLLVVLLFGLMGFVLGSFGFAPIIFGFIDLIKYMFGIFYSLIPQLN